MSVAGIMYFYGGALIAASALGLDAGVPSPEPAPAVPLTVAMGGAMLVSAFLSTPSGAQPPKKGERGFGSYMAGVHIGLLLPLLYAGVFGHRAYMTRAFAHRAVSLSGLSLGSVITFLWLVAFKPKKKKD